MHGFDLLPQRASRLLDVSPLSLGFRLAGLSSAATLDAAGTSSRKRLSRLAFNAAVYTLTPVTLPPGRLKLATKPIWTTSPLPMKTMGIIPVPALAASTAGVPPLATMTATRRRTRSSARVVKRSYQPSAQRYSIATLRPST